MPSTKIALRQREEPRASWDLRSELLFCGLPTGKWILGYVLDAWYPCAGSHLIVTSWDCGDDSLSVTLTDGEFNTLDEKSIGAMYDTTLLESHEALSDTQVLLRCDNNFLIRVTIDGRSLRLHQRWGELTEFVPYP
ncbi:hypothetical protein PPN31114_02966 [Pandoraea pneumonica]|jgi:hypothetical protein|uniref:Uncharacterized protein n=1 Tax=Pandoraea pneumonica TaxID=2508299 RepID=A0A5E4W065_9BURK|nr:hypothetical protein PPN31114_02966 [Pandoraea pneumonica]